MADIARIAGVSVTTVSHVVNGTRAVSPGSADRVRQAIAKVGYVPDNVVRSMRTTGTRTLGVAMSAMSNPLFGEVVSGIEQAAAQAGYSLMLTETHDDPRGELRAVSELLNRHVEAIVLAPTTGAGAATAHAGQRDVPVVLVDRFIDAEADQIGCENAEPCAQMVDHLIEIGHRRIAFIGGRHGLSTSAERIEGYKASLRRHGLRVRTADIAYGDSTSTTAQQAFTELMGRPRPPTAIVTANNQMTIGAMRAARDLGIGIPDDIALVCFDDFDWADLFHPRLTAMAQPARPIGEQAFGLALTRLADRTLPPRRVVIRPTFMHRESCGCPADSGPAAATAGAD
mgnify:FL=1